MEMSLTPRIARHISLTWHMLVDRDNRWNCRRASARYRRFVSYVWDRYGKSPASIAWLYDTGRLT
jgi:hypothetical protein